MGKQPDTECEDTGIDGSFVMQSQASEELQSIQECDSVLESESEVNDSHRAFIKQQFKRKNFADFDSSISNEDDEHGNSDLQLEKAEGDLILGLNNIKLTSSRFNENIQEVSDNSINLQQF